jgi:cobalamin biosynthesis Mg chelatase CobN
VFRNSSFLVDYLIERNGGNNGLVLTNTTTQLLDTQGNALVSVPKSLVNSTMVRLNMMTFVQPNTVTNFTLKIIGYGNYNTPFNGKSNDEIETEIPLQLNLSSGSSSNTTNTTNTTSTVASTSTSTATNSTRPTTSPTNTANSTKASASPIASSSPVSSGSSIMVTGFNTLFMLVVFYLLN